MQALCGKKNVQPYKPIMCSVQPDYVIYNDQIICNNVRDSKWINKTIKIAMQVDHCVHGTKFMCINAS